MKNFSPKMKNFVFLCFLFGNIFQIALCGAVKNSEISIKEAKNQDQKTLGAKIQTDQSKTSLLNKEPIKIEKREVTKSDNENENGELTDEDKKDFNGKEQLTTLEGLNNPTYKEKRHFSSLLKYRSAPIYYHAFPRVGKNYKAYLEDNEEEPIKEISKRYIGSILKSQSVPQTFIAYPNKKHLSSLIKSRYYSPLNKRKVPGLITEESYPDEEYDDVLISMNYDYDNLGAREISKRHIGSLRGTRFSLNRKYPYYNYYKRFYGSLLKSPSYTSRTNYDKRFSTPLDYDEVVEYEVDDVIPEVDKEEFVPEGEKRHFSSLIDKKHVSSLMKNKGGRRLFKRQTSESDAKANENSLKSLNVTSTLKENNYLTNKELDKQSHRSLISKRDLEDQNFGTDLQKSLFNGQLSSLEENSEDKRHVSSLLQNNENKNHLSSLFQNSGLGEDKRSLASLMDDRNKRHLSSLIQNKPRREDQEYFSNINDNDYEKRHFASLLDNDFDKRHLSSLWQNKGYNLEKKHFASLLDSPDKKFLGSLLDDEGNIDKRHFASLIDKKHFASLLDNSDKRHYASLLDNQDFDKRHFASLLDNSDNKRHFASLLDNSQDFDKRHFASLLDNSDNKRHFSSLLDNNQDFDKRHFASLLDNSDNKRHFASLLDNSQDFDKRHFASLLDNLDNKRHFASLLDNSQDFDKRHFASLLDNSDNKRHFASLLDNDQGTDKRYLGSLLDNSRAGEKRHFGSLLDSADNKDKKYLGSLLDSQYNDKRHFSSLIDNTDSIEEQNLMSLLGQNSNANKRYFASVLDNSGNEEKRHYASLLDNLNNIDKRHYASLLDNKEEDKDKRHFASLLQNKEAMDKRHLSSLLQNKVGGLDRSSFDFHLDNKKANIYLNSISTQHKNKEDADRLYLPSANNKYFDQWPKQNEILSDKYFLSLPNKAYTGKQGLASLPDRELEGNLQYFYDNQDLIRQYIMNSILARNGFANKDVNNPTTLLSPQNGEIPKQNGEPFVSQYSMKKLHQLLGNYSDKSQFDSFPNFYNNSNEIILSKRYFASLIKNIKDSSSLEQKPSLKIILENRLSKISPLVTNAEHNQQKRFFTTLLRDEIDYEKRDTPLLRKVTSSTGKAIDESTLKKQLGSLGNQERSQTNERNPILDALISLKKTKVNNDSILNNYKILKDEAKIDKNNKSDKHDNDYKSNRRSQNRKKRNTGSSYIVNIDNQNTKSNNYIPNTDETQRIKRYIGALAKNNNLPVRFAGRNGFGLNPFGPFQRRPNSLLNYENYLQNQMIRNIIENPQWNRGRLPAVSIETPIENPSFDNELPGTEVDVPDYENQVDEEDTTEDFGQNLYTKSDSNDFSTYNNNNEILKTPQKRFLGSLARRMWFPRPYRSFVEPRSPSRSFPLDPNNLSGFQSRITSTSPISPSYPYYQMYRY
ncbi:UNVERIFIED_CONTAM: hypothetical protein RMT77_014559 [Armadillidium vulgare]